MAPILFSDGSDLIGVQESMEIRYMKYLRLGLQWIASWPYAALGFEPTRFSKIARIYLPLQAFVGCCLCSLYIKANASKLNLFILGHSYITTLMCSVMVARMVLALTKGYGELTRSFIEDLHLFYHKYKSDYAMKVHIQVHKISNFFTVYSFLAMLLVLFIFNSTPVYNNFSSGAFKRGNGNVTFELIVYYSLPFDVEHNLTGYVLATVFHWYICSCCSFSFCVLQVELSLITFHICGHMKILINNLKTIPMPQGRNGDMALMFDEEESEVVSNRLKECLNSHEFILNFSQRMSDVYGAMLFIFYAFYQISGCILFLECSRMDVESLTQYGPLTLIVFQLLIQISIIFELTDNMNDRLIQTVYDVPWECMDSKNRQLVGFMLMKVQKPLRLKALGIADVGVRTMAAILKTSFSYFAFLKTSANRVH